MPGRAATLGAAAGIDSGATGAAAAAAGAAGAAAGAAGGSWSLGGAGASAARGLAVIRSPGRTRGSPGRADAGPPA